MNYLKAANILLLADKTKKLKQSAGFVARKQPWFYAQKNNQPVYEGSQIQIGGNGSTYLVCRKHWFKPEL